MNPTAASRAEPFTIETRQSWVIATVALGYLVKATALACGLGLLCLNLDVDLLTQIVNALSLIITGGPSVVGGAMTAYGLIRKVKFGRWAAPQS